MKRNPRSRSLPWCLLALWLATSTAAFGQWHDQDGTPLADEPWRKVQGDFGAMLLISPDPADFLKEWAKPPSQDDPPNLETTDTARRGDMAAAFVLFQGCRANKEGLCDATVDFEVRYPDGSVYAKLPDGELWVQKPAVEAPGIQLGVDYMVTVIEADDPLGDYTVQAKLCDRVADSCLDLSSGFEAIRRLEEFELAEFFDGYYLDPRPEFMPQLIDAASDPGVKAAFRNGGPISGFLAEIFARNPEKVPSWMDAAATLEDEATRQVFAEAEAQSENPKGYVFGEPPSPSRNDLMWGAYFASGDTAYLDGIVAQLEHTANRTDQNLFLTGSSAQWSLASNLRRHRSIAAHVRIALDQAGEDLAPLLSEALERDPGEFRAETLEVMKTQQEAGVW